MKQICIYTTPGVLKHKKESVMCYWSFSSSPKIFDEWEKELEKENYDIMMRLYFAIKGFVRGYFELDGVSGRNADFDGDSWKDIKPIPQKQFQGFKYIEVES